MFHLLKAFHGCTDDDPTMHMFKRFRRVQQCTFAAVAAVACGFVFAAT
jgi:hypothetical protein